MPSHQQIPLAPGTVAPDFVLPDSGDRRVRLSELRGQPVVLAFYPPGWDPSRNQQRELFNDILARVEPHGATLLGIEMEGIWCDLDFADRQRLRFPLLRDVGPDGAIARAYGVDGQSALFVVDADGMIRWNRILPSGVQTASDALVGAVQGLSPHDGKSAVPGDGELKLSRRHFLVTAFAAALAAALGQHTVDAAVKTTTEVGKPYVTGASVPVALTVNGTEHHLKLEPRVSLLDALRENIGLTGTKKGCNQGACGACTVLIDGQRVNSCLTLAIMHQGQAITTVEGLQTVEGLHPVQAAIVECDGFQCGYCTSGQVVSAVACIREGHTGSDEEIREWMSGNICRCGAYPNIVRAVQQAAGATKVRAA